MTKFEYEYAYDEGASVELHMDVVHDAPNRPPVPVDRWVEAMRRLNAVNDPLTSVEAVPAALARQLLALHRNCSSGRRECDSDGDSTPMSERRG